MRFLILILGSILLSSSVMAKSFYDFKLRVINSDQEITLSDFQGQVVMIVNTASKCGFTKQYADLESLYDQYKDKGFTIIATPSNNFANQEPNNDREIEQFIQNNYQVSFPVSNKIEVKGGNAHPLYVWLKQKTGKEPIWNFQKYIIGKDGEVIDYFLPSTSPSSKKIQKLLNKHL